MQAVEWGEYELQKLFTKIKISAMKYKTSDLPSVPCGDYVLPALTAGVQNQGLNNYVPREKATVLKNVISISANGANTGATFYQSKEFAVLQDAYAIKWTLTNQVLTDNQYLFLTGCISKAIYGNYEWTNKAGWEKIKGNKIFLPVKCGQIDFDFMENFVAELESYLLVTGLKDYTLTADEEKSLKDFNNVEWKEFDINEIFTVKNTANILSSDIVENSGIASYIEYDKQYLEEGNCIFVGGKTFVVSYQEKDFYSNDSHNLALYLDDSVREKTVQFYVVTCLKRSLKHKYSWGDM